MTKVFKANGYPKSLVSSVLQKPHRQHPRDRAADDKELKLLLPYVKGVSERIEQRCKKTSESEQRSSPNTPSETA